MARWVPMLEVHLDAVSALEQSSYGGDGLFEGRDIYGQRLRAFPGHMFVLLAEDDSFLGHAVTLPIRRGQPPLLGEEAKPITQQDDVVHYLLDIALRPEAQRCRAPPLSAHSSPA
jgi:hypothetical protein